MSRLAGAVAAQRHRPAPAASMCALLAVIWASLPRRSPAASSSSPREPLQRRAADRRWWASSRPCMVLVIVARQIDLSVGSVMGFVGVLIAYLQYTSGWSWPAGLPGRAGGGAAGVALPGLADGDAGRAVLRGHAGRPDVLPRRRLPGGRRQDAAGQRRVLPAPGRRLRRRHRHHLAPGCWRRCVRAGAGRAHAAAAPRARSATACRSSRCGWTLLLTAVPVAVVFAFVAVMNSYRIAVARATPQGIADPGADLGRGGGRAVLHRAPHALRPLRVRDGRQSRCGGAGRAFRSSA